MNHTLRFRSAVLATLAAALVCFAAASARADDAINVYRPGGPAPAMKEAAQAFGAANKITVNVVSGPTPQWVEQAKADADVVFSGAENMMSDFAKALPGAFDLKSAPHVWLIWNIWQVSNPDLAQLVEMEEPLRIYRDSGEVLTHRGAAQPQAKAFVAFLQSPAGQAIFAKWGWKAP